MEDPEELIHLLSLALQDDYLIPINPMTGHHGNIIPVDINSASKGFTLVELIIVVAIIAILAGAIFVAIDPARRLHEARNARRSTDVATILDAIKKYQVDNDGEQYSVISSLNSGNYYQIGTANESCDGECGIYSTDQVCADISGIGSSYMARIPQDPQTGSQEMTRYAISPDINGAITIKACDAESEGAGGSGDIPDISITR